MDTKTMTDSEVKKLMESKDYKKRFVGEYYELGFTFDCPYSLLSAQSNAMWTYLSILDTRAQIEQIDL